CLACMLRLAVASARPAMTNDKGEFRLYGLAPSSYYLTAYLESFAGPKVETDVTYGRSYYPGVLNVVEAERVWVRIGEEVQGITISLIPTRSSRISGVAKKAEGSLYSNGTGMLRRETACRRGVILPLHWIIFSRANRTILSFLSDSLSEPHESTSVRATSRPSISGLRLNDHIKAWATTVSRVKA